MFWRFFPRGYLHSKETGASALKGELKRKRAELQMAKHKTGAEEPKEIFEDLAAQQEVRKTIFSFLQFCEISEKV